MREITTILAGQLVLFWGVVGFAEDYLYQMQTAAIEANQSPVAHWGWIQEEYTLWGTHTNRLTPVYTFGTLGAGPGIDLISYQGCHSPYRSSEKLRQIYQRIPEQTLNPQAVYFDQTNIYHLQKAGLEAGKKHIILVVFDGMDWQTTYAASIYKTQKVCYHSGRGSGLHFQDYRAEGTTQFGYMVTSPFNDGMTVDITNQKFTPAEGIQYGGYSVDQAGAFPWSVPPDAMYLVGKSDIENSITHAYTDSASSATSMTSGQKTFNGSINIAPNGQLLTTIAHLAQQRGYKVGAVSSVPISHATPAASYAHNVSRNDYQDLSRDLLGLPSVSHPETPLPGLDLLMGTGINVSRLLDAGQGDNVILGDNTYLTTEDLQKIDSRSGGNYVVALRTTDVDGAELLKVATEDALAQGKRLFGFFGTEAKHLPFQTANGDYNPAIGRSKTAETYTPADRLENPTLSEMTEQALLYLGHNQQPFWLMIEAGDVDWANHDNNLDNSIGAVLSGDAAVKVATDWVEKHSNWNETLLIVTADHGHYLVLDQPELLIKPH